jgi:hypothetical protein
LFIILLRHIEALSKEINLLESKLKQSESSKNMYSQQFALLIHAMNELERTGKSPTLAAEQGESMDVD